MVKDSTINSTNKTQLSFSIRQDGKIYFVSVDTIAFVCVEKEMVYIVDFDGIKHPITKTLETIENLVSSQQFYRINRQLLVNRNSIKGVENYSNQRILVNLTVPTPEAAIVPRAKVKLLLNWMEKG